MKIVIFGAGAQGRVIIDILKEKNEFDIIGFIDSNRDLNSQYYNYPILGRQNNLIALKEKHGEFNGIIAIGDNYSRSLIEKEILNQLPNFKFTNAISNFASISPSVKMGFGNAIINSEAVIGNHCILNTNSSLEHNCIMNSFSSLAPGVTTGGYIDIGKFSAIALGSTIFDRITIGENVVIGSGSTVTKDLESNFLYYGTPAKKIKPRKLTDKFLK
jgi:sugar O-acyltransferase (sialic acid O-acetyltransferase NeuD family)